MERVTDNLSFDCFESASRTILKFLYQRFDFDLWLVTRQQGDYWFLLHTEGNGYKKAAEKGIFRWTDSFCSEMVKGNGPNIAPQSNLVEAYRTTTLAHRLNVKAYIGFPIYRADGSLFGTLCGIDPLPQPAALVTERDLFEMLSSVLTTVIQTELSVVTANRRLERLRLESLTDPLTKLSNRRAWDQFLAAEEARCRRYGDSATVLVLDLDGLKQENDSNGHAAGDALLQRTGHTLRLVARESDMVARLGGDEFGIIAVDCSLADGGQELLKRVREALASKGIRASIGIAERTSSAGLKGTWERADQLMYEEKHSLYTEKALVS